MNTSVPVVSGVAQVGESLSASTGSWVGTAPVSYAYRWQRCSPACVEIPGATTSSYPVVAADLGATLRVGVTGSNTAGSSEAFSAQTPAVTAAGETTLTFNVSANADDGDVTVSGSVGSGYPPSGAAAANSSGPVFTAGRRRAFGNFQILVPLLRFDTSSLPDNATVTSAKLRLHVTGKADDDNRSLVGEWYPSSNWPIDPTDWTQTTGTSALVGADLTGIAVGTSNELNLSGVAAISVSGYTGLRLGISGGQPSGDNYLQIAALEHASNPEPQLVVTYTTSGGPTAPVNTSVPVVSGVAQVGESLSASTGSWVGTAPVSYAYRWQRCSPACVEIPGATTSSYPVVAADLGATLRVGVTGSNSGRLQRSLLRADRLPSPPPARPRSPSTSAQTPTTATSPSAARWGAATRRPARRRRTRADRCSPRGGGVRSATSRSWCRCCVLTPPPSPTMQPSPQPSCACT